MKRLLVLRPEPGASATVERARQRGLSATAIPLFEIEPVDWEVPDAASFDALLLTSANAIRCAGGKLETLRGLPVHAVGEATAAAARDAGFDLASTGDGGVDRLLGSLEPDLKLLHLCGENRRGPDNARHAITPVAAYRAKKIPVDLRAFGESVALIHSPRAGKRLAQLVDEAGIDRESISVAAISANAADAVGQGWACVETAPSPEDDALLVLAERLCNKNVGQ